MAERNVGSCRLQSSRTLSFTRRWPQVRVLHRPCPARWRKPSSGFLHRAKIPKAGCCAAGCPRLTKPNGGRPMSSTVVADHRG